MTASENERAAGAGKLLRSAARGLIWSAATAAILLLIFTFICYVSPDPDKYLSTLGLAALYGSALIGGIVAGKRNGIAGGLVSGLLLTAAVLIASAFKDPNAESYSPVIAALLYLLIPLAGGIGSLLAGITSGKRNRKKPTRRPQRRK